MLMIILMKIKWVLYTGKYSNQTLVLCAEGANIASCYRENIWQKSCFNIQKTKNFDERSTLFHCCFIRNGIKQCWYEGIGGKYPPLLLKPGWIIVLVYTIKKLVYFWQYTKKVVGYLIFDSQFGLFGCSEVNSIC